jgi:hypothetical protein
MEMSGHLQATVDLPPGKDPLVFIDKDAGWALESVWMLWRKHNSLVPTWN